MPYLLAAVPAVRARAVPWPYLQDACAQGCAADLCVWEGCTDR